VKATERVVLFADLWPLDNDLFANIRGANLLKVNNPNMLSWTK